VEILILIAIMAVGASALYVALKFDVRTRQVIGPLVSKAAEDICQQIKTAGEELGRQTQAIAGAQQRDSERIEHIGQAHEELQQQIQVIADDLARDRELAKHPDKQIDVRQDQLSSDLLRLDRRVAQVVESLAQQGLQIAEIRDHFRHQRKHARNSGTQDSLLSAMLKAESHIDRNGWGQPPHLYALTEKIASQAADHERADEMRGAALGGLIPVEQGPLPDGDLKEVLANMHWPEDVVGCVLVTELGDLQPRNTEGASIDRVAARQWASTHPDARPARLVVGVCRSGERKSGLRIKGEDDVQVRTELADDLVTALLGTFSAAHAASPDLSSGLMAGAG